MIKILTGLLLLVSTSVYAVDPVLEPTTEFTCQLPIEREDGTPLVAGEIVELRFHYGSVSGVYNAVESSTVCAWVYDNTTNSSDNNMYLVVTAVDADGRESKYSAEKIHGIYWVKLPNPPVWD